MDIGSLTGAIDLEDNISSTLTLISARINKLSEDFDSFANGTASVSVATGTIAADAFAKLGSMIVDAANALPRMVMHSADVADNLRDLSNQTDVSVEALSQFRFVASQTGTNLDTIARTIFELGKRVTAGGDDIREALAKIGVSFELIKAMSPDQAFVTIFEALATLPTAAERAAAGYTIFGRQFRQISQLAKEDVKGLMEQADLLGLTISTKTANEADKFNDALDVMAKLVENAKNKIATMLIPALTAVAEKAPLAGGAVLLLGDGLLGTVASFATIASGVVPFLALTKDLGNTIPILTARVWLLDVAQKATAISTGLASTAMGAFVLASGPVIVAIAAVSAALAIGYQAWMLYKEHQERASADQRQQVTDAANLERLNTALGTSYKSLADASAEFYRRQAEGGRGLTTSVDAFAKLGEATKAAQAEIAKLSDAQRNQLTAALKDGVLSVDDIRKALNLSSGAIALFKKDVDAASASLKENRDKLVAYQEAVQAVNTKIVDLQIGYSNLNTAQLAEISSLKTLGLTTADIALKMGIAETAVSGVTSALNAQKVAIDALTSISDQLLGVNDLKRATDYAEAIEKAGINIGDLSEESQKMIADVAQKGIEYLALTGGLATNELSSTFASMLVQATEHSRRIAAEILAIGAAADVSRVQLENLGHVFGTSTIFSDDPEVLKYAKQIHEASLLQGDGGVRMSSPLPYAPRTSGIITNRDFGESLRGGAAGATVNVTGNNFIGSDPATERKLAEMVTNALVRSGAGR